MWALAPRVFSAGLIAAKVARAVMNRINQNKGDLVIGTNFTSKAVCTPAVR
jgi:hypothetical protein